MFLSYWKLGCDAAKANIPFKDAFIKARLNAQRNNSRINSTQRRGFENGYIYGMKQKQKAP